MLEPLRSLKQEQLFGLLFVLTLHGVALPHECDILLHSQ